MTKEIVSKTTGFLPTDVIHVLKAENPKKPGTLAAGRYALYKDGMTVAAYQEAVKQHLTKLKTKDPEGTFINYARGDLKNDTHPTRQYIAVVAAKA